MAETFTVAWRRWDDVPAEPLPWLLGIACKVLANARRSASRADALAVRAAAEPEPAAPELAEAVTGAAGIRAALGRLSAGDRETLMLVAWDGLGPAAAARAAGCSRPTFAVRLHRARARLSAELAALDSPSVPSASEVIA